MCMYIKTYKFTKLNICKHIHDDVYVYISLYIYIQVIVSCLQQVQGGARPTTEGSRENIGHNMHV